MIINYVFLHFRVELTRDKRSNDCNCCSKCPRSRGCHPRHTRDETRPQLQGGRSVLNNGTFYVLFSRNCSPEGSSCVYYATRVSWKEDLFLESHPVYFLNIFITECKSKRKKENSKSFYAKNNQLEVWQSKCCLSLTNSRTKSRTSVFLFILLKNSFTSFLIAERKS